MCADDKAQSCDSRALVLLSGGLDSATTLAYARRRHKLCYALSFSYGQRHDAELAAAKRVADHLGAANHQIVKLDATLFESSALIDKDLEIPGQDENDKRTPSGDENNIPVTYVPARNLVFLSMALARSETLGIRVIYIGVNAVDYSGYPDCRPSFIKAFEELAALATRDGVSGAQFQVRAPLIDMSKAEIIKAGLELGVDYGLTVSCYQASKKGVACGRCDACRLRRRGFADAGVTDPAKYCQ